MRVPACKLASLGAALSALSLWGQPVPQKPVVTILPPANTVMLTQTVQAVFATVTNFALFTNASVQLQVLTNSAPLYDDGTPPDVTPGDGTFSGNLFVPAFPVATNFTARFTTTGQDLSVTNDTGDLLPESWATNVTRVTYLAAVRPVNDNFTNALKIAAVGGVVLGTNAFATIEPAEPWHGGDPDVAASLWWTWSPATNNSVFVDTGGSSFAPVLGVYLGTSLATLKLVAWSTNDVEHGLKANAVFEAKAGTTYRIAVAGFDTNGVGTVRLSVTPGGAPDQWGPLVEITSPAPDSLVTTNLVSFAGTAQDPEPYASGVTLVMLQLNDALPVPANGTTNWSLTLPLTPGTNVVIALAEDLAGNVGPPATVTVLYNPAPNDHFTNAFELTGLTGTMTGANDWATLEPGEPPHAGNEGGHSLWYYFAAPASGSLVLNTDGSTFDTLLALYEGDSVTNLTLLAENDDALPGRGYSKLTVALRRGHVYHVAADGFGGATGLLKLQFAFTATEVFYRLNLTSGLGGNVVPPTGLFLEGSTQIVTALPARDFVFTGWQGSRNTAQNPLSLVMTQDFTLTASFRLVGCTEDFEAGDFSPSLPWAAYGHAGWTVRTNVADTGRFAARSGAISDNQISTLALRLRLLPGTGAFRISVNAEPTWDRLEFYLNGVRQREWSGVVGWENYQFPVIAGTNTLEWVYAKDANFSRGLDAAFIDNVYLPLPDQPVAPRLTIAAFSGGLVQLAVQGYPGQTYTVEASPDFISWVPVVTRSSTNGSWVWLDPAAPLVPMSFYRATAP